jgi:hypothetical protein
MTIQNQVAEEEPEDHEEQEDLLKKAREIELEHR